MEVAGPRPEARIKTVLSSTLTHNSILELAITSSPIATISTLTSKPIALTLSTHQTSTPTPSASVLSPSRRMTIGATIGIAVGVLVILVAMAFATALFIYKRRQHKDRSRNIVANDPNIPTGFKAELPAQEGGPELPDGQEIQIQADEEQRHINVARQDEDSVSFRTAKST
jgi:hypothetical protein